MLMITGAGGQPAGRKMSAAWAMLSAMGIGTSPLDDHLARLLCGGHSATRVPGWVMRTSVAGASSAAASA
jgi:hypothetical protein